MGGVRYPGALWVPSPNFGDQPGQDALIMPILGVVQHTMVGSIASADTYFAEPSSQVSAHFGVAFTGEVHQYVDTDQIAWHAGFTANRRYHGIEFEDGGNPDTPMTVPQIEAAGKLIAWLAQEYGWKVGNATQFGQVGIIGHIEVWPQGGHTCPNPTRLAQKALLIAAAAAPPAPLPTPEVDMDNLVMVHDTTTLTWRLVNTALGHFDALTGNQPAVEAWQAAGVKLVQYPGADSYNP